MKVVSKILLVLVLWSLAIAAQNHSPKPYDTENKNSIAKVEKTLSSYVDSISAERIITTAVVVGEILILLIILFYWKKTREDSRVGVNDVYKKNIIAIRDERIKPIFNKNNSVKRVNLKNKINSKSLNGRTITRTAKKLAIAKGELFLIAKMKQLQEQAR